jgi:hypothetical protein
MKRAKPDAGTLLLIHLRELGVKAYTPEFKFCSGRRWRADFAIWPHDPARHTILVEIEGAVWAQGRHTRGSGYVKDLEKYNMAASLGYRLFRFTTEQVLKGYAKEFLRKYGGL